jgi:glycolate oxidase iron-sulfur subunit
MQVASALDRQGTVIAMAHTIEVLDASLRGLPLDTLIGPH